MNTGTYHEGSRTTRVVKGLLLQATTAALVAACGGGYGGGGSGNYPPPPPPPPAAVIRDAKFVDDTVEGLGYEVANVGSGHTDGDVILFLPRERIAFLGDLFFNRALPNTQDSFLLPWIATLGAILKLDADVFVPGHGPVGNRDQLKQFLGYLDDLKASVEPKVNRGDGMEQVLRETQVPAKYASFDFQSFFPANIQRMYIELKELRASQAPGPVPKAVKKKP